MSKSAILKLLLSSDLCLQLVTSKERVTLTIERAGSDLGFLIGWGAVVWRSCLLAKVGFLT